MKNADSIGVFYGSSTGNAATIASLIQTNLSNYKVEIFDVAETPANKLNNFDILIFGVSTWGIGDIQDDFEEFIDEIEPTMLTGKTVALYGLGDQITYADSFVDGLGKLYEKINPWNIKLIGKWQNKGYSFHYSSALLNGSFLGLVIDEDNQEELTKERVKSWAKQLHEELQGLS